MIGRTVLPTLQQTYIRLTQQTPPPAGEPPNLQAWAVSNGAYIHPNVTYRSSGGMFATGTIDENDVLMTIPKSLTWR